MVNKPKGRMISLRIPPSLYKTLKNDADAQFRTLTSVIVEHLKSTYKPLVKKK